MGKYRLLDVDDDIDIANLLKIYFTSMNFDVDVAMRGSDALEKTKQLLPHLIILDIMLPDIDGYEVCRNLRTNLRTSHIPVIFLTQKDERSDKLQGLELGAEDYITKPFEIEELKLRIQGVLRRLEMGGYINQQSGLPTGSLVEEQLRRIIREKGWALLNVHINNFDIYKEIYDYVSSDNVLRFTAMLISEVVDEFGTSSDFIGHVTGDDFIIITSEDKANNMKVRLKGRFDEEVRIHYSFTDRKQGFMQIAITDGTKVNVPFMTMSVGSISPSLFSFADFREITKLAVEACNQDITTINPFEEQLHHIIREKGWDYLHIQIKDFEAFEEVYGGEDSDKVLRFTIKTIKEVLNELGLADRLVGRIAKDRFTLILPEELTKTACDKLKKLFNADIISFYHYVHLDNGYIRTKDGKKHPFMRLAIGVASPTNHTFKNIKEIAEFAEYAAGLNE